MNICNYECMNVSEYEEHKDERKALRLQDSRTELEQEINKTTSSCTYYVL